MADRGPYNEVEDTQNKSFIRLPPDADSLRQHCLRAILGIPCAPPLNETPPPPLSSWTRLGAS